MKNPIPGDWEGEWCQWSVCWPDSPLWRGILLGLLTSAMRGRFWDEKTGNIKNVQVIGREIFDRNYQLQECIVSCNGATQLAEAMNAVARAIANRPCCGSGAPGTAGGTGTGGAPGTGPAGSEQGDSEGDYPAGFGSYAEYRAYKCAVAHWIIDQFKRDVQMCQDLNMVLGIELGAVSAILGATFVTPIPGDELLVLAGMFLLLVSNGVYQSVMGDLEDSINDGYDSLVCALFNAADVTTAKAEVEQALDDAIDNAASGLTAMWCKSLKGYFFNYANLNKLFEKDSTRNYSAADCSGCEETSNLVVTAGELISGTLYADDTYHEVILEGVIQPGDSVPISVSTAVFVASGSWQDYFYWYGMEVLAGEVDSLGCDGNRQDTQGYANGLHFANSGYPMASFNVRSPSGTGVTVRVRVQFSTNSTPPP